MDDCLDDRENRDSVIGGFRVVPGGRGRESEGGGGTHLYIYIYIYIYTLLFCEHIATKMRTVTVRQLSLVLKQLRF